MPPEHVIVEADGGSRGNPGPAGYGAVVLSPDGETVLAQVGDAIGVHTNNVAEYRGLIAGLQVARDLGARRVSVRMDSKLVVEQMSGRWGVKHPDMRALAAQARELCRAFEDVGFAWIPREKNTRADRLANEAMDRAAETSPKQVRAEPASSAEPTTQPAARSTSSGWTPPTGPPTRLVLVRHGSTAHSAERRLSGRNELPLNDVGRAQAAALATRSFGDVAAVISSPLRRAVETAQAIAAPLGLDVHTEEDLIETDFGVWEGMTFAQALASHPEEMTAWRASPDVAPPGGESFTAVGSRVRRGREAVVAAYPGSTVVVVTHVTPIKTLVRFALDAPPSAMFGLHLDTASVSTLDYFADATTSLRLFNDTSHLPEAP